MPRKSKKAVFRGTPSWKLKKKGVSEAGTSASELPVCDDSEQFPTPTSESLTTSKCESRLQESFLDDQVQYFSPFDISKGYRLIDLECLSEALLHVHKCPTGGLTVVDENKNNGSCATLTFMCTSCGEKSSMLTSKQVNVGRGKAFDVNRRAVLAMSEQGKGREALASFCGIMGMQPPSASNSWMMHKEFICNTSMKLMQEEFIEAGQRLRKQLKQDDDSITESSELEVTVSFDGTWHHRGFKSSNGVGVAMSVDTGEILDAVVLSKTCSTCQKHRAEKTPEEFEIWQLQHKNDGECEQNFDGPSANMETAASKILWARSVQLHNMRYMKMLSDGDNKTLASLNEQLPYGPDAVIEKVDCVNHVHKRLGTGLRNLLKTSPHIKGGRGGLTKAMIDKLSQYYRGAIMCHATKTKEPGEIKLAVSNMKQAIMASLCHNVYNKDASEQHKYCSDLWCKWKQDQRDGTESYDHSSQKSKRLPENYLSHMIGLYERLSEERLLKRCLPGLTQNQNEAFNSTIWQRCPKERYFGAKSVNLALASASMSWNIGKASQTKLLNALNLAIFPYTLQAFVRKDKKRIENAKNASSAKQKLKRKSKKTEQSRQEKIARRQHGVDYAPGQM